MLASALPAPSAVVDAPLASLMLTSTVSVPAAFSLVLFASLCCFRVLDLSSSHYCFRFLPPLFAETRVTAFALAMC